MSDNVEFDKDTLLQEYREAMESQRSLSSMAYSWTGSIFLVLSTGLFFYGTQLDDINKFVPTMVLALVLAFVWLDLPRHSSFMFAKE